MKFHWMLHGSYPTSNILKTVVKDLGSNRYESILLTFQLNQNEPMVSAMFLTNNFPNQRFMVAVRPYTISSRHLSMMAKTFYEYFNNKLIINFVSGTYDNEYELFTNKTSTREERKDELYGYIKSFVEDLNGTLYSDIAISGASDKSISLCSEFSAINIALIQDLDKLNKDNNIMLRVSIGVDLDKSQMTTDREFNNSICGTEDYIINKIKELEAMGITDILISNTYENITEINKTNALVDRYKSL